MYIFFALLLNFAVASEKVIISVGSEDIVSMTELNPHQAVPANLDNIRRQIYDTIYELDMMGNVKESLVDDCAIRTYREDVDYNSYMELLCKVRSGVYFHDGEPLTADDVVFSLERVKKSKSLSSFFSFISSVEYSSKLQFYVRINFNTKGIKNAKEWIFERFKYLSARFGYVVRKKYFEGSLKWALEYPVGTGPYYFKDWKLWDKANVRSEVILLKNKSYWKKGCPKYDEVRMRFVPPQLWKQSIRDGTVSLLTNLDFSDYINLVQYQKEKGFVKPQRRLVFSYQYLLFSPLSKTLKNGKLRSALLAGIDRMLIVDTVLSGNGMLNTGQSLKNSVPFDDLSEIPVVSKADSRKLVSSLLKIKNGKLKLSMLVPNIEEDIAVAEKIAAMLYSVGFDIKINKREIDDYNIIINKNDFSDFDLFMYRLNENPRYISPRNLEILASGGMQLYQRYAFYATSTAVVKKDDVMTNMDFSFPAEGPFLLGWCEQ